MNIVYKKKKYKDKVYQYPQLVHSFREGKKVSHEVIANLSHLPKDQVEALDNALKLCKANNKNIIKKQDMKLIQNIPFGSWFLANELSKQTGLQGLLNRYLWGKYVLLIIYAKLIAPTSKLGILDLVEGTAAKAILGIDEDLKYHHLLQSMDDLIKNQDNIEEKLFKIRSGKKNRNNRLVLYDVTSSYVEGETHDLSAFGYNRDGKKGHKQVVIGLACDSEGFPITVEVFEGNTVDTKTVSSQINKLKNRFNIKEILFVGDRGMIKGPQKDELKKNNFEYLTAISTPQIKTLISKDIIQLQLFDENIEEVISEDKRYILRRNPIRAKEIQANRQQRIDKAMEKIEELNNLKKELTKEEKYHRASSIIEKYNLKKILNFDECKNKVEVSKNQETIKELEGLDGCYVMETNNISEKKEELHRYYKQLSEVESGFKLIKTQQLELRPIFHRKEQRIRAHVFLTVLAYHLLHQLDKNTIGRDYSLSSILEQFKGLSASIMSIGGVLFQEIPEKLTRIQADVLQRCGFKLKLPNIVGGNF